MMYVAREQRYCHRKGHCQRVTKIGAMETIISDGYLSHVRTSSGSGNRTISIRSHRLISDTGSTKSAFGLISCRCTSPSICAATGSGNLQSAVSKSTPYAPGARMTTTLSGYSERAPVLQRVRGSCVCLPPAVDSKIRSGRRLSPRPPVGGNWKTDLWDPGYRDSVPPGFVIRRSEEKRCKKMDPESVHFHRTALPRWLASGNLFLAYLMSERGRAAFTGPSHESRCISVPESEFIGLLREAGSIK